ncbi:uncharacterized protein LOC111465139 isoform X2 [Cucurbita maxima]|uniref:Uncharacterized protein LOC111465139 isoform X2 n=1 Tax=Cucurbita maxima TaxID=3661 RepID=A0A6J1HL44_CUCMA|nr:uncharacterized protein LOC111465139 isoform X2 [Cucurbita maxima]
MDFGVRAVDNQPLLAASSSECSSDHPLRELVKQRIKGKITNREIASRRMLEAETRMELIIEQELSILRATGWTEGLAFDEHFPMRMLDLRLNQIVDQSSSRVLLAAPGSCSSLNS